MNKHVVGVACLCLSLTGCGNTGNAPGHNLPGSGSLGWMSPEKDSPLPGFEQASICYESWEGKLVLVVWSDFPSMTGTSHSGPERFECKGYLHYDADEKRSGVQLDPSKRVEFVGAIQKGQVGRFTIDGRSYDMPAGSLVLVSGAGGRLRVKLLSRDMSDLKFERESLVAFGTSDPELAAFFAEAVKPR